ncbi:MAG: hypothetical protein HZB79_08785 [Deltaproteobacteria bacterium]|nr:hypothetical protein [Deltaproteobacteria bacterium]
MSSLFFKRVSFAGIVIIGLCLCIFFSASDANAQFRRGRYTLTGSLNWEYETYSYEDNKTTRERVRFLQNYNLNLAGNIIDPRLVTFNAGLTYRLDDADTEDSSRTPQSSNDKSSSLNYNLSLSFFPRSWYPFKIYGSRSTVDTTSRYYPSTTTTNTSYGGEMLIRFTRLPEVSMNYSATNSKTENPLYQSEFQNTYYSITLSKRLEGLWDSYITGGHASSTTDDIAARTKTTNNVYYFNESSQISKTTSLGVSALLNEYKSESPSSASESQYASFNATLSMQPSKRFRHGYAYDYSGSESSSTTGAKSETTTNTLSGNAYYLILREWPIDGRFRYSMTDSSNADAAAAAKNTSTDTLDAAANTSWKISKDLSSAASMAYYTQDTSGSEGGGSTDRLDTAMNAGWAVNKNLSTSASLAYYTEDISGSTGDSSSKSIAGTASAGYSTPIKFLNFRSGYTIGYSSVSQEPGDDTKTTTHALNVGVGSSYKGRNLSATGDYNFTYTTSTTGDDGETHTVSLSAVDTHLPRTVINASADWYLGTAATILSTSKSNTRSAALSLTNDYFSNTLINASAKYVETHTETGQISTAYQAGSYTDNRPVLGAVATGSSETKTLSANANIDRYLGRFGRLSLKGSYLKTDKTNEIIGGYAETITTKTMEASHYMWWTRRLSSEVSYTKVDTTNDRDNSITSSVTTTESAVLNYRLGKWSVNANYKYILTEEIGAEREEQTFILGISRTFRLFL